jgi:hypothetical protein
MVDNRPLRRHVASPHVAGTEPDGFGRAAGSELYYYNRLSARFAGDAIFRFLMLLIKAVEPGVGYLKPSSCRHLLTVAGLTPKR